MTYGVRHGVGVLGPHPGYTAGRVWLDGETMVDHFVEVFEEKDIDVYYNTEALRGNRSDTAMSRG